jgi:hypothetical protein
VTEPVQVIPIGEPELSPETVTERALEEIIQGSRVIHARHQGFTKAMARKLLDVMQENAKLREALEEYRREHALHCLCAEPDKGLRDTRCHICKAADALLEAQ